MRSRSSKPIKEHIASAECKMSTNTQIIVFALYLLVSQAITLAFTYLLLKPFFRDILDHTLHSRDHPDPDYTADGWGQPKRNTTW